MKYATTAKIVAIKPNTPLFLPSEMIDILRQSSDVSAYLLVFRRSTGVIRILPSKSNFVYKLIIEIGELGTSFLEELGNIYEELRIRTLFTTGLCFEEDRCTYEAFMDPKEISIDLKDLEGRLSSLDGVSRVTILEIKLE